MKLNIRICEILKKQPIQANFNVRSGSATEIVYSLLIKGNELSAKCIQRHTGVNNAFDVIYKLRRRRGLKYIKTKFKTNKLTGKKYAVYYI